MIITICVTLFLSLLTLHVVLRYNKAQRIINKIPGPTPLPFFGNLLMFNVTYDKIFSILCRLLDKYYPIVRINRFIDNTVFIRHPEDMKIISSCKENIEKANIIYRTLRSAGDDGLILSGGEKWQHRRKMLNPAFNPNLLKVYVEIANEHTERFVENIKSQSNGLIPDLVEVTNKLAMGVICEAVMGSNSKLFDSSEAKKFRNGFCEINKVAFYRASRPYIQDWMMKFLRIGREFDRAINNIHEFTKKVIHERREYHKKVGHQYLQNKGADDVYTSQRKRLAILDLLLAAETENLIDEWGIIEELEVMILAGYETTGATLAFALLLLAENAEAQDLAREEVTEIMNRTGGVLTVADLTELKYLDRCIKESLRIFPSGPIIGRNIKQEIKLSNYKIPVGTDVGMSIFALHRDPNFWPDPEKFDPDRFLPENVKERHPFAYMPFSAGPRSCIGSKFAMLKIKAIVAKILYNFYLVPVDSTAKLKFEVNIVLKMTQPCRIKLIKINRP